MRHAQVLQFRPVLPMRSVIGGAEAGVYPVEKEPVLGHVRDAAGELDDYG